MLLLVFRSAILSCDRYWLHHHRFTEVICNFESSRAWYRAWSMLISQALARFSIIKTRESSPTCEFTKAHNAQSKSEHWWRFPATLEQSFRLSEELVTSCTWVIWIGQSGRPIRIATSESRNGVRQDPATMIGLPTLEVVKEMIPGEDLI